MAIERSNSVSGKKPPDSLKMLSNHKLEIPTSAILYHFGTSAVSVATATGVTHPLDVLKVRLQMQLVGQRGPLTGLGRVFTQMLQQEGPRSFYLGLGPALTRSVLYGGLRLGLYEPTKYVSEIGFGTSNILLKLASGAFAGSLATALTNPVDVIKVRTQMSTDPRGGSIKELRKIVSEEGIRALWKGVGPSMARAAALTASQLATYDESKQASKQFLIEKEELFKAISPRESSSTIAGLVSTLMTAPIDMVKTRLMLQRGSGNLGSYKNGFHCAYKVVRTEGPRGLYKGGFTLFARLGPQTMITFILCEKLRNLAGLHAI